MISFLGFAASAVALVAAVAGVVAGARVPNEVGLSRTILASRVALAALTAANLLMVFALVGRDFSIAYVAQVGSRATPLLYTVASLWGALEGSILFWSLLLAGAAVLLERRTSAIDRQLLRVSLCTLLGLLVFFLIIVVGPGDPWRVVDPVPSDGPGPNPLLQNHPLMAIHPPLLYLGFVGLAIPYALTMAALVERRLDGRWLFLARRWTLGPWIFLTLGLLAGSWWSYAVLGWGGYWAWDPVENVALLPWLTSTAFLHSAMVQARRGNLRNWNLVLVTVSFLLTILATLVTRSGILNSVHSFTESIIGPLFLIFFGLLLTTTIGLATLRTPDHQSGPPHLGTRASAFLLNNLLFVVIAATVLVGTLFPLFVEAASGAQVSVGTPYFERVIGPIAIGLIVLMGIGPSLPWGGWDAGSRARLLPGTAAGVVAGLWAAAGSAPPQSVVAFAAGMFAVTQSIWYIGERVRGHAGGGLNARSALARIRAQRRAMGGLIVHLAFGIIVIAVAADASGRLEVVTSIRTGQTVEVWGEEVELVSLSQQDRPDRRVVVAELRLGQDVPMRLEPALNWFPTAEQPIATPSIATGVSADLYVVMTALDPTGGSATFRIMRRPLVSWIWAAGLLAAFGGLLAIWPRRRSPPRALKPEPGVAVEPVGAEA